MLFMMLMMVMRMLRIRVFLCKNSIFTQRKPASLAIIRILFDGANGQGLVAVVAVRYVLYIRGHFCCE